jgi:endoglycosylceramidase
MTSYRALLLLVLAFCASCSSDGPKSRTSPDAVHIDGRAYRDGLGRHLILRGYNARVTGMMDVTYTDGRLPQYVVPPFGEADFVRFEQLGFNVLRLPINWSALEPTPGQYEEAFLVQLEEILDWALAHDVYVLIDMHQDGYSKEIGEDGAPRWAVVPYPEDAELTGGPADDDRRLQGNVIQAGLNFFADAPAQDGRSLQQAFIEAAVVVARRVAGHDAVLGYEAFNEPVMFDTDVLRLFHERFAMAIHDVDRDAPVFFEPRGVRNQLDYEDLPRSPWSAGPGSYAPHIYTRWFTLGPEGDGWITEDPALLAPSMEAADREATAWNVPLFIGEFGCDQTITRGPLWLSAELDLQDRFLASSAAWVWAETNPWGANDGDKVEREATIRVMSRPFPRRIAGTITAITRPSPDVLRVAYTATARTAGLAHELSASAAHITNVTTRCDGVETPHEPLIGRVLVTCPAATDGTEHVVELSGTLVP